MVKNLPANAGNIRDSGLIPGQEDPLERGLVAHSSILAWRILWTEEPGRLQSMRSQRVGPDWSGWACMGWVLVAAHGIFTASRGISHCGAQTLKLWHRGSAVAVCGLSCSAAYGILVLWPGIRPVYPYIVRGIHNHGAIREVPVVVFKFYLCRTPASKMIRLEMRCPLQTD